MSRIWNTKCFFFPADELLTMSVITTDKNTTSSHLLRYPCVGLWCKAPTMWRRNRTNQHNFRYWRKQSWTWVFLNISMHNAYRRIWLICVRVQSRITYVKFANIVSDWEQQTSPLDLPIFGEPNKDIFLELGYPKIEPVFELEGKRLKLLKPLDRDKDNLSHLIFQVKVTYENDHDHIVWSLIWVIMFSCAYLDIGRVYYCINE